MNNVRLNGHKTPHNEARDVVYLDFRLKDELKKNDIVRNINLKLAKEATAKRKVAESVKLGQSFIKSATVKYAIQHNFIGACILHKGKIHAIGMVKKHPVDEFNQEGAKARALTRAIWQFVK